MLGMLYSGFGQPRRRSCAGHSTEDCKSVENCESGVKSAVDHAGSDGTVRQESVTGSGNSVTDATVAHPSSVSRTDFESGDCVLGALSFTLAGSNNKENTGVRPSRHRHKVFRTIQEPRT